MEDTTMGNTMSEDSRLIDRAKALELLGGDEEMLEQIYDMFVGYVPNQVNELKEAMKARDLETLNRISHSLKSNAGTIGCERLMSAAYQMEMAVKDNEIDLFERHFKDFQILLDSVIKEIGRMKQS